MRRHEMCIFALTLLASGTVHGVCTTDPSIHAKSAFSKIESLTSTSELAEFYQAEFSPPFKLHVPFATFYTNLMGIYQRLGIGQVNGRNFASRALSPPKFVTQSRYNQGFNKLEVEPAPSFTGGDDKAVKDLEFITTSSVGKVRQRIQLICWENKWLIQGFWYLPEG